MGAANEVKPRSVFLVSQRIQHEVPSFERIHEDLVPRKSCLRKGDVFRFGNDEERKDFAKKTRAEKEHQKQPFGTTSN